MAEPPWDEDYEQPAKSKRGAVVIFLLAFIVVFIMAAIRVVRRF